MGGDATVTSSASQQNKTSQSQSSTDSSQVDGAQPMILNPSMTFSPNQLLYDPDEQSLLHKNFRCVKTKQLLQEESQLNSLSSSGSISKSDIKKIIRNPSTDHPTEESLESCEL